MNNNDATGNSMLISKILKTFLLMMFLAVLSACDSSKDTTTTINDDDDSRNQRPTAVISPEDEQFITVGDAINFVGDQSFDIDGNSPLSYEWEFSGSMTSMPDSEEMNTGFVTFAEPGRIMVSLVVTDSLGKESRPESVAVNVAPVGGTQPPVNTPPDGTILSRVGSGALTSSDFTVTVGTDVEFSASATDADNDPVNIFDWSFPANVTVPAFPGNDPFIVNFPMAGTFLVSLTVTDIGGSSDPTPAQLMVTVVDATVNLPPDGSISHDNGNGTIGSTGDVTIVRDGSIIIAGSAVDPEGDTVSYDWSIPAGVTVVGTPGSTPFTASFPTAGVYLISLTVSDINGNVDATPAILTVSVTDPAVNLPPNGSITHDNGDGSMGSTGDISLTTAGSVLFSGSGIDPEGDNVTYAWTIPAGVSVSGTPDSTPFTASFPTAGTYLISLMVTDINGNADATPAQVTVTVTDNLPPEGSINHNNGDGSSITNSTGDISLTTGGSVVFSGWSNDPEGDAVTYDWIFPAGVTVPATPGSGIFSTSFPTAGTYLISLTVTDSNGNVDATPAEVTVTVTDPPVNLPPNGSITHDNGDGTMGSTGDINLTTAGSVLFSGSAIDPEGDDVTYAWTIPAGVSVSATPGSTPFTASFPTAGTYLISLTVTDINGNADATPAQVTVTVTDPPVNLPPNGSISHDNGDGTAGSTGDINISINSNVVFSGSAIDPEGDNVAYTWTIPSGVAAPPSPGSAPFTASFSTEGTYLISLTVTDSNGNADATPAQVTVVVTDLTVNSPPNGSISHDNGDGTTGSVGNFTIFVDGYVVFVGSAIDPEGDAVTYAWSFPAAVTVPATTGSGPFTANFPATGAYLIALVATDSNGNSDLSPAQVIVTVLDAPVNQPPNGSISHDNGDGTTGSTGNVSIITGGDVVFVGSAVDPDGDALTYAWTFPANATAPATTGSGPLTVNFPVAGIYIVSMVATDSNGNTDSSAAQLAVTVVDPNQPPNGSISHDNGTGTAGTVGDVSVTAGASIVFAGGHFDPENDPVTYDWDIPADVTVTVTPGSGPFVATFPTVGTYLISLTVTDSNGNVDATPAEVTVTVVAPNFPPDGSISHDNGAGATGSTGDINIIAGVPIVFNASADDPEGDAVTFAWVFNASTASATTGAGPITVMYSTPGSFVVSLTATDSAGNVDLTPAELTVNVSLPEFQFLPVLTDEDGNPDDNFATYSLRPEANVNVNVTTPLGNWVTPMMRYNGLQLQPVIVAKRGTQMTLNVQNNLGENTTVHWHGFKIPAIQDGGPDLPIAAAASRVYSFSMEQPAAPLWFHPHAHGYTATQVYNGLAGAFIVTDDISDSLETNKQIPAGTQDIAMLLQDRRFAADPGTGVRELIYVAGGMMATAGMLGDHVLVNGVELPGLDVDTRQYRFRIFNGSNARTYDVALADGAIFSVVGTDGGLLNAPVQTDHVMLAAGERAEIVVDFSDYAVGTNVMLVSRSFSAGGMMGGGALPNGSAFDIMRFEVTTSVVDDVVLYSNLPANADINTRLTATDATAPVRGFVMSMGVGMQFFINGKVFDETRIDEVVANGAVEIWDISNTSQMAHPFHAHAIQWQILDRNGVPATGVDLGWKDTVLVGPDENVRFIGRFDPVINVGEYMYHCHILEHEEAGMMGIFQVQ